MATVPFTTIEILTMLSINEVLARHGIYDDMLTYPEGISHLNIEYSEGIQSACSGYAKRTPAERRFTITQVQQKRLTLLMYWVKDNRRIEEPK